MHDHHAFVLQLARGQALTESGSSAGVARVLNGGSALGGMRGMNGLGGALPDEPEMEAAASAAGNIHLNIAAAHQLGRASAGLPIPIGLLGLVRCSADV